MGALSAETQQLPDPASEYRGLCFSDLGIPAGRDYRTFIGDPQSESHQHSPERFMLQVIGVLFEVESIREDQPRNILQVSLQSCQAA